MKYETTVVDLEAGKGGVYQTTVAPVPFKSSRSYIWKTVTAIAVVLLCGAAAFLFSWHVMQGKALKQIAEKTKAAIHLRGEHGSNLKSESLKWVSGVDQSFEQGGLKLLNNEVLIPADGLYFVYSQVSYSIQCNQVEDEDDSAQNFLSHSIWRYTDAVQDWKPLQNSAHSVCQFQEDGKTTYSTIYLGAVFKLMEGDKLKTKTKRMADVEEAYAKTFFGVFAL
ncbi:hypothetical protein Q8A67_018105 [Cirrhinus molitorella]|uniref:Lymphotoxin-alpha n=1 Tax=Cirrhinus molitorella TaxID=172907 RepID=A0AA88PFR7_9TELE|nr:hypothetical protein Q8A67_018105 [Cirrhinus molitorella]